MSSLLILALAVLGMFWSGLQILSGNPFDGLLTLCLALVSASYATELGSKGL